MEGVNQDTNSSFIRHTIHFTIDGAVGPTGFESGAIELGQTAFDVAPETLNAVCHGQIRCRRGVAAVAVSVYKQAVVGFPAVGVNRATLECLVLDSRQQFFPGAVFDNWVKIFNPILALPTDRTFHADLRP